MNNDEVKRYYRIAIDIQDACNMYAVVGEFYRAVEFIKEEYQEKFGQVRVPFQYLRFHPIIRLFLDKLADMSGLSVEGYSNHPMPYHVAYDYCQTKADGGTVNPDDLKWWVQK